MRFRFIALEKHVLIVALAVLVANTGAAANLPLDRAAAKDVLRLLVESDTTAAHGTVSAAQAIAARLTKAGFAGDDVQVLAAPGQPSRANALIRVHGSGRDKALLVIGHVDVVEAPRGSWSVDPFKLTAKDGFFYGRGVLDLKGEDAAILTPLIRPDMPFFVARRPVMNEVTDAEKVIA